MRDSDDRPASRTDVPVPRPAGMLTLADVHPGDTVQVRAVPPGMRDVLADLGVREGAEVRCESSSQYVVVRTPDGSVPFERALVAEVAVSPVR